MEEDRVNPLVAVQIGLFVLKALKGLMEARSDGKITKEEAVDIMKDLIAKTDYAGKVRVEDDTRLA